MDDLPQDMTGRPQAGPDEVLNAAAMFRIVADAIEERCLTEVSK